MQPSPQREATLFWPAIGTLVFVLVLPVPFIGLVPLLLSGWTLKEPLFGWPWVRWAGVVLFLCSVPLYVDFIVRFVREGRGTPAPIAPPRQLVVTGSFRHVRNPGYVAAIAMIFAQGLFFGSRAIVVYAFCVALAFHIFVVLYEEPGLRKRFGAQYAAYCHQVHRWMPRLTPAALSRAGTTAEPSGRAGDGGQTA